jgi:hypothetical protein
VGPEAKKRDLTLAAWAAVAVGLMLGSAGCPEPAPLCEEKADLVAMDGWTLLPAADDPFDPPADAPFCTAEDVRAEPFGQGGPLALDVDTRGGCGWATVRQELLEDLAAGDEVQVRVWYFSQTSFPASEARIALAFDGDVVWSVEVPIPASSTLEAPRFAVEKDVAAGRAAHFHVGNHGDNTWNLLELSRIRKVPCPPGETPPADAAAY